MDQKLDIKITTAADTSGAQKTEKALDGVTAASARAAKGATFLNESLGGKGGGTGLGKGLEEAHRAGEGLQKVFGGLESASAGGVRGLVGMTNAARGLFGIIRALVSGPIGLLIGAVGLLGAAFIALTGRSKETGGELDAVGSKTDAVKAKLESLEATTKKSMAAQLAELKKVVAGYEELLGMIDKAEQRTAKEADLKLKNSVAGLELERKQQLASAKTQEQKDKINKDFDRNIEDLKYTYADTAIENRGNALDLRRETTQSAAVEARAALAGANLTVRERAGAEATARDRLSAALERVRDPNPSAVGGDEVQQAVNRKRDEEVASAKAEYEAAVKAREAAEKARDEVQIEATNVIIQADNAMEQTVQNRQDSAIESGTLDLEKATRETPTAPTLAPIDESRAEAARARLQQIDSDLGVTFSSDPRFGSLQKERAAAQAALASEEGAISAARAGNDKKLFAFNRDRARASAPQESGRVEAYSGLAGAAKDLVKSVDGYLTTTEGALKITAQKLKQGQKVAAKQSAQIKDSRP